MLTAAVRSHSLHLCVGRMITIRNYCVTYCVASNSWTTICDRGKHLAIHITHYIRYILDPPSRCLPNITQAFRQPLQKNRCSPHTPNTLLHIVRLKTIFYLFLPVPGRSASQRPTRTMPFRFHFTDASNRFPNQMEMVDPAIEINHSCIGHRHPHLTFRVLSVEWWSGPFTRRFGPVQQKENECERLRLPVFYDYGFAHANPFHSVRIRLRK